MPMTLSEELTNCLEKFVLRDGAHGGSLIDCIVFLEQILPGIRHEIGISDDLPSFKRYLLGG